VGCSPEETWIAFCFVPLIEKLQELCWCQTCLSQDGSQRDALDHAVLQDDHHPSILVPLHCVAPLGPHVGEADRLQRTDNLAHWQVR